MRVFATRHNITKLSGSQLAVESAVIRSVAGAHGVGDLPPAHFDTLAASCRVTRC